MSPDNAYWTQVSTANASSIRADGVDVASDGTVITTGSFSGQAVFPTGANADDSIVLTSSGAGDIFVAGLDSVTGYFTWAQRAGGSGEDAGNAVDLQGDDTALLTGFIDDTASFPTGAGADDSIVLTASGDRDIFVAAVNPGTGYFAWAQRAGGTSPSEFDDIGKAIVSHDDTIIVTGEFEETATFPTGPGTDISLTAGLNGDAFIASVDPDTGFFRWVQQIGGSSASAGQALAINSLGQPIVAGRFADLATFPRSSTADDSFTLTGVSTEIFVAAMNADDSYFDWAQRAGGDGFDEASAIAITADDTPIITGRFFKEATFPTGPGPDDTTSLKGKSIDIVVAALNSDDSYFAWAQRATGPDTVTAFSVAVTSSDSVVMSGYFRQSVSFPTGPDPDDSRTFSSSGFRDAYVAGFDPLTGYFTWVQTAASSGRDGSPAVAILGGDTPVAAGYFGETAVFPSGPTSNLSITAQPDPSDRNMFIGLIGPAAPNPDPDPPVPAPVTPPSVPTAVSGERGDASATITWNVPTVSGSYAVTHYQVQLTPGGASCLVTAPTTQCTISELVNGVSYTASVRALNGAGWGPFSAPSEPFTPVAPVVESIVITGSRGEVRGRPGVIVRGVTTEMAGEVVTARVRLPGQASYATGSSRTVSEDERFTWQRRTAKKIYVIFQGDSVRSNRLIIPAR